MGRGEGRGGRRGVSGHGLGRGGVWWVEGERIVAVQLPVIPIERLGRGDWEKGGYSFYAEP